MEVDTKNTTVAEIFKLLTTQLDTDFELKSQDEIEKVGVEKVGFKMTPKEQMEAMMTEVVHQY